MAGGTSGIEDRARSNLRGCAHEPVRLQGQRQPNQRSRARCTVGPVSTCSTNGSSTMTIHIGRSLN